MGRTAHSTNVNLPQEQKLAELRRFAQHVSEVTQLSYEETAYIKQSPTHRHGIALDIAPRLTGGRHAGYGVTNGSDPVLHRRPEYLRALMKIGASTETFGRPDLTYWVTVENDHLHLMILPNIHGVKRNMYVTTSPRIMDERYVDSRHRNQSRIKFS